MKLFTLYTPSHEILYRDWFLPSIKDDFEIEAKLVDQLGSTADYLGPGWTKVTIQKIELVLRAIEENSGEIFVFADVDIQFFRPVISKLLDVLGDFDMAFQKNGPFGEINSGFFVCRANENTKNIWKSALSIMKSNDKVSDQLALNSVIFGQSKKSRSFVYSNYLKFYLEKKKPLPKANFLERLLKSMDSSSIFVSRILNKSKVRYLPDSFFSPALYRPSLWNSVDYLEVPSDIYLHHANWTIGVENKIKQLEYLKSIVVSK